MSRRTLYIAITSHGFGHAVRTATVAAKVKQLNPDILLIFATTAPRWLLESYLKTDFIHRLRTFDVGVIQTDSLTMDKAATLAKMQHIQSRQNWLIQEEVNFIHNSGVGLILADIPPLAASIAQTAGIPCWLMSNFGWDFIYRAWGGEFRELAAWISDCYQQGDRTFRLPLSEPMSSFNNLIDVGLTGGEPHYTEGEIRDRFQIFAPPEKTVLLTFGGLGLQSIPYQNLARFTDWQFITFDRQAPDLPNLLKVTNPHYRPVDFMPFCGKVVSKPGYSTFAEALRLDIPVVSLIREDFAEAPLLLTGIQDYSYHQIITTDEFISGDWDFLPQESKPPRQKTSLPKDGTEAIAQAIVNYFANLA